MRAQALQWWKDLNSHFGRDGGIGGIRVGKYGDGGKATGGGQLER